MIFVRSHFGGSAPRDVVSALHRKVVETHHQVRFFSLSTQQLSEAIQHLVKEHHMTWFQFAQYLLRSRTTCLLVFKIVQYIGGKLWMRFVYTPDALF